MVEKESTKSITTLRTDNKEGFTKKKHIAYLSNHGIQHKKCVPYTPQRNGDGWKKQKNFSWNGYMYSLF